MLCYGHFCGAIACRSIRAGSFYKWQAKPFSITYLRLQSFLMKKLMATCLFLCISSVFTFLHAQTPATVNSADIYMQLKKLNVLGSVLYIAAHPDDENTRLLSFFAREKEYRTGYLSLTRGDGGQNLIGDEQGLELGLIRTQELLAARRIDGAEQFFSRAYDFGFCKTSAEALQTWGHDKTLNDVVWVIRKFQPDIIITRFPGDERAGHGHHQASQILAQEAFTAAADKTKFPEQFTYGVQAWQVKRIFWNTFNFGNTNTTNDKQFKMNIGVFNPLLGKSYGEIASESRSQHKSQGFGVPRQRGESIEYFDLTAGDPVTGDLMEGVVTDWNRVDGGAAIQAMISSAIAQYDFAHPERSVTALANIHKAIRALPEGYWRNKKLQETEQLIVNCSGIFAEAVSNNPYAVQGDSIRVQFFINKRNDAQIELRAVHFTSFDSSFNNALPTDKNYTFSKSFFVPASTPVSQPYWLEKPLLAGSFDVSDQNLIGKAENDPAFTASYTFAVSGEEITVLKPLQYKFTDPVKGEVYQPLRVVPAMTAKFEEPLYIFDGNKVKDVQLQVSSKQDVDPLRVTLNTGAGWKLGNAAFDSAIKRGSEIFIKAKATYVNGNMSQVGVVANGNNNLLEEHAISYDHIPSIVYWKPLTAKLEKIDIVVKGKNIGYITGAGDKIPQALQQLGYNVKLLNESDVNADNLRQFDAVLTGVRAYNVHDWLFTKYDALMQYVRNGGNLIVQYNTSGFNAAASGRIGPYNFTVSRTRVTDQVAEVNMLQPNNPALNFPNKITAKDFEGWIQERSIYQAEGLDNHYAAPLGMHDANETESNGSLIIAPYGKGNFVYTGLVFFRELPAGVPGAYRLMANLIALPQNKQ